MILAVVLNAKTNRFVYGKKIFKETILWFIFRIYTTIAIIYPTNNYTIFTACYKQPIGIIKFLVNLLHKLYRKN
jgi:hypothetical protein